MASCVKRMNELDCVLALKETEVRERCEKLERIFYEKETKAKDKSEKICTLEAAIHKKHNEIMAIRK